jgi:mono/diheme cytochrome c family protein
MPRVWFFGCCALYLLAPVGASAAERPVDFNRDIRPILSNTCFTCHGFDDKERKAGLRLDTVDGQREELESGEKAVVPGAPDESALIARVLSDDENLVMPPPGSNKELTPEQRELLVRWVAEGGKFGGHWSFEAPKRPEPPTTPHDALARTPIDRFIFARLAEEKLTPPAEADKTLLLRRATLDLTGLPPTPAEIEAFLADQSPEAYEKAVDRLLASPRYGEHFAREWLDAVRYADTHGLHFDNERSIWPYRDWVIRAFNENKPFDQFTVEQIAGDLLPNATLEQKIATGFGRCNLSTSEGGSIDDEVLVRYAIDRTEATGTVWLGLTVGCAVCHSHKYDPLSQHEFYQLFAYFNGLSDAAMDGNALAPPPSVKVPSAEQKAEIARLDGEIAAAKTQIADAVKKIEYQEPAGAGVAPNDPHEFVWIEDDLPAGAKPGGDGPWQFVSEVDRPVFGGQKASYRQAEGTKQHYFTDAEPGLVIGAGDKLFANVYIDPSDPPKTLMLQFNNGNWEHRAFWGDDLIPFGTTGSAGKQHLGPLPEAGKWVRLEVDAKAVGLEPGAMVRGWAFTQHGGSVYWDTAGIVTRTPQAGQKFESLAAWSLAAKANPQALPDAVKAALDVETDKRSEDQVAAVRSYFLEHAFGGSRDTLAPLHEKVATLEKQKGDIYGQIPDTLVMAEMEKPRDTHLLIRGAYDKKGDKVEPGVPAVLPPLPKDAPANRLGLARWIVDPQHPLMARVVVNRYWQHYFGIGLVKTTEDFGAQGEQPSHPELLDWLATEFISSGWDVKHLQKLIVMSHAYRQSSQATPELLARDPENRLLARGPRFRLDAEVVRDAALASSGLLVEKIGGRSVKPYQPDGVWEAVAFLGSNTSEYKADPGEGLYRRSLYTFWKRTSPPASMSTFDAPSRETCTVRRPRTNTPLQALALLNDVQFVEASRKLAERMMTEGGATAESKATAGFRLATARAPRPEELAVLLGAFGQSLSEYVAHKDEANKLLAVGISPKNDQLDPAELAAWTMVANMILNLDETITKE